MKGATVLKLAAILWLCLWSLSCRRAEPQHLSPKIEGSKVYIVPIGDFPREKAESLAQYCHQRFDLNIEVAESVPVPLYAMDLDRNQAPAEKRIAGMRDSLPALAPDSNAILIGLTQVDVYPSSVNWKFAFGWRQTELRAAVVSTARMNIHYFGEPFLRSGEETRLRKVVLKDIGILYYGLPQSANPKSVLYRNIMGIEELDSVGEDF